MLQNFHANLSPISSQHIVIFSCFSSDNQNQLKCVSTSASMPTLLWSWALPSSALSGGLWGAGTQPASCYDDGVPQNQNNFENFLPCELVLLQVQYPLMGMEPEEEERSQTFTDIWLKKKICNPSQNTILWFHIVINTIFAFFEWRFLSNSTRL